MIETVMCGLLALGWFSTPVQDAPAAWDESSSIGSSPDGDDRGPDEEKASLLRLKEPAQQDQREFERMRDRKESSKDFEIDIDARIGFWWGGRKLEGTRVNGTGFDVDQTWSGLLSPAITYRHRNGLTGILMWEYVDGSEINGSIVSILGGYSFYDDDFNPSRKLHGPRKTLTLLAGVCIGDQDFEKSEIPGKIKTDPGFMIGGMYAHEIFHRIELNYSGFLRYMNMEFDPDDTVLTADWKHDELGGVFFFGASFKF